MLEARIPAQGPQEGLLEGVVCGFSPGEAAEVRVDLVAVRLVEALERRYRHGVHHVL